MPSTKKVREFFRTDKQTSRLQCSKCFYIFYLSSNEPRNCLRCLSNELHDFQKKNNNLIRIQKKYTILIIKQLSPFVSGGSPLPRNYYWILDFQYLFSLCIFENPKNSAINVGPVGCETNLT
jgi:hypothetical protein